MNTTEETINITTYSMALGAIAMVDAGETPATIREAFQQMVDVLEEHIPDFVKIQLAGIIAEEYGE